MRHSFEINTPVTQLRLFTILGLLTTVLFANSLNRTTVLHASPLQESEQGPMIHFLCDTPAEIKAAAAAINKTGKGGLIEILPGSYELKSNYYAELQRNPQTATNFKKPEDVYGLYISSPNTIVRAYVPGTVTLQGQANAIINPELPRGNQNRMHRGGGVYVDREATGTIIEGINFDGQVAPSDDFNINCYCHRNTDDGKDCWDWSHKAIKSVSKHCTIRDCKIHDWAGEMVYGGSDAEECVLIIQDCELYNCQVSALSGNWHLLCQRNHFHHIDGNCMEGLHSRLSRYYDNHFSDIGGAGINILGPVKKLAPEEGWWIEIRRNVFERVTSRSFGAVYVSRQTTPDVISPRNILVEGNTFRDCRNSLTASLGNVEQIHFLRNLIVLDTLPSAVGIAPKSGSFLNCLFKGNEFTLTQNARQNGGTLDAATMNIGKHTGTRFIENYYENCSTPFDAANTELSFEGERYHQVRSQPAYQRLTNAKDHNDVPIPTSGSGQKHGVTGFYSVMNANKNQLYLRLMTEDQEGQALYVNGTEMRIQGLNPQMSAKQAVYLIDGRGCQLTNGWPVVFRSSEDYVQLRYNEPLKCWIEVERHTPCANRELRLTHHGRSDALPQFDSLMPLIIDDVNVISQAFAGWHYYETDTRKTKIWTVDGWVPSESSTTVSH